mmetsp:Transcript_15840/g.47683  ORF Transcript_15840/g.47683 Transcript_15840/m.47683 type:complete len:214 (+) Transcript_15840:952-1593(+)
MPPSPVVLAPVLPARRAPAVPMLVACWRASSVGLTLAAVLRVHRTGCTQTRLPRCRSQLQNLILQLTAVWAACAALWVPGVSSKAASWAQDCPAGGWRALQSECALVPGCLHYSAAAVSGANAVLSLNYLSVLSTARSIVFVRVWHSVAVQAGFLAHSGWVIGMTGPHWRPHSFAVHVSRPQPSHLPRPLRHWLTLHIPAAASAEPEAAAPKP